MGNIGRLRSDDCAYYFKNQSGIFCETISKVENSTKILEGQEAQFDQLMNARNFAFPWSIKALDMIFDHERNASCIRFGWDSKKVGLHITTAILKFNLDGQIAEINEVYNKFSDITH